MLRKVTQQQPVNTYKLCTDGKYNRLAQFGLFLLFLLSGFIAIGPIQWGNIPISVGWKISYKILVPFIFLLTSLLCKRTSKGRSYCKVFFTFFVASLAMLAAWITSKATVIPNNSPWSISLAKLLETLPIVGIIILFSVLSEEKDNADKIWDDLFIKKGRMKLGLTIGIVSFVFLSVGSIFGYKYIIYGDSLSWMTILTWTPLMLLFCFSNGILEEILYRGLFLKKFESILNFPVANLLQALVFASIHLGVTYTANSFTFLGVTFILGLVLGWIIKKTDSLIPAILLHAGCDFMVVLSIFSNI